MYSVPYSNMRRGLAGFWGGNLEKSAGKGNGTLYSVHTIRKSYIVQILNSEDDKAESHTEH